MTPAQQNSLSVTLRPVQPDDRPFQLDLYAVTRDDLNLLAWEANQKQALIDMQFRAQSAQYCASYPEAENSIILIDDRPVGRMIVDRNQQAITLVDIAILPAHRNAGIGTVLIRGLIEEANASGRSVRLHVLKSNPAQRLYLRLGFSIVGDDAIYFEMKSEPNNPWVGGNRPTQSITTHMATLLTHEEFAKHLNTSFLVRLDDANSTDLELVEVSELLESPQQTRFSIVFRGPGEVFLGQGMRHFESEQMGQFDLFIVPINKNEEGLYYESCFNRMRPKE